MFHETLIVVINFDSRKLPELFIHNLSSQLIVSHICSLFSLINHNLLQYILNTHVLGLFLCFSGCACGWYLSALPGSLYLCCPWNWFWFPLPPPEEKLGWFCKLAWIPIVSWSFSSQRTFLKNYLVWGCITSFWNKITSSTYLMPRWLLLNWIDLIWLLTQSHVSKICVHSFHGRNMSTQCNDII